MIRSLEIQDDNFNHKDEFRLSPNMIILGVYNALHIKLTRAMVQWNINFAVYVNIPSC